MIISTTSGPTSIMGTSGQRGFPKAFFLTAQGLEQIVSDGIRKLFDWDERRGPQATDGVAGFEGDMTMLQTEFQSE